MRFLSSLWELLINVGEFFLVTVVLKGIFAHWAADNTMKIARRVLVKSRADAIYWIHFKGKAMKAGHQHDTPVGCTDGWCKTLKVS